MPVQQFGIQERHHHRLQYLDSVLSRCSTTGVIQNGTSPNQDVADRITYINQNDYKHVLDVMPDGTVVFEEANANRLSAVIQINDCRTFQYHRYNGLTAIQMR